LDDEFEELLALDIEMEMELALLELHSSPQHV
jgi:hypothetical protein